MSELNQQAKPNPQAAAALYDPSIRKGAKVENYVPGPGYQGRTPTDSEIERWAAFPPDQRPTIPGVNMAMVEALYAAKTNRDSMIARWEDAGNPAIPLRTATVLNTIAELVQDPLNLTHAAPHYVRLDMLRAALKDRGLDPEYLGALNASDAELMTRYHLKIWGDQSGYHAAVKLLHQQTPAPADDDEAVTAPARDKKKKKGAPDDLRFPPDHPVS